MNRSLPLYNQSLLSDDDFIDNFVARQDVLGALLRRLQALDSENVEAHQILIGLRGMGKSSLLRRLAIAIKRDTTLGPQYTPLTFREEQYNVLTLGDFWRNCGEALAEWAEANNRADLANRLDAALASPDWAGDEKPEEQFTATLDALGRRAVLLVDNIDLILDALTPEKHWELRRTLQARRGPIVIGAATQNLKQSADRQAAFYEFFYPHYLDPLTVQETERCMRALAARRGQSGNKVVGVLNSQPQRLKTLHGLTGGNPRVLALVYRLLESAESTEAMADLEILLDQVTPYYKARIEDYQTPQQRAIIDAIALHWDPITIGVLSDQTGIATTTLSSQLLKLRKDGLIEQTEVSASSAGHQIAERFLNIWYLMRHGTRRTKHKMRWLVQFLTLFYSPPELAEIAGRLMGPNAATPCHPDYAVALSEAMAWPMAGDKATGTPETGHSLNNLAFKGKNAISSEILTLTKKLLDLSKLGRHAEVVAVSDDLLTRFADAPERELREPVAKTLFNKGVILGQLGRSEDAIATYDALLTRFADAPERELREPVAEALVNKGVILGQLGRNKDAITLFDDLLSRFGNAPEPALWVPISRVLINKGASLDQLGRHQEAILTYDDFLNRFGEAQEPALREAVVVALFNRGTSLSQLDRTEEAIAAYDDLLARFGNAPEPALHEQLAKAIFNKGFIFRQRGNPDEEIAAYNDILARFADTSEPALRLIVAVTLLNKGGSARQLQEAIAAYNELLTRFGDAPEPALREQVAKALFTKGFTLNLHGRTEDAIAVYDDLLTRFGDAPEPTLREWVANTQITLANLLLDFGRDATRAETLYQAAAAVNPPLARGNLAWLYTLGDRVAEARTLRESLDGLPARGCLLIDAGMALAQDNFGLAAAHLHAALAHEWAGGKLNFTDDLNRVIRLAARKGHGERLIAWFEETGFADRMAPLAVAVKAYIRGETVLRDVNPEVRHPARILYDRLNAPRRVAPEPTAPTGKPKRRGRKS